MLKPNKRTDLEKQLQMENDYLKKEIALLREQIEFYKNMLNTTDDNIKEENYIWWTDDGKDPWWIFE